MAKINGENDSNQETQDVGSLAYISYILKI